MHCSIIDGSRHQWLSHQTAYEAVFSCRRAPLEPVPQARQRASEQSCRKLQRTEMNMPSAIPPTQTALSAAEMIGAEILVHALAEEGVEYVWGYPGGAAAVHLRRAPQAKEVRAHPGAPRAGRGHAADGYARATGKVGVALVTSGLGVTNAVTGIATAYLDSIPMVVINIGNVPTHAIGAGRLPGKCDTVGITRPIVKHTSGEGRARLRLDHQEGVLHCFHRLSRPGWSWTSPRMSRATPASTSTRSRSTCARTTR
ncbi:thiamine pyrophosphate-binding protein [Cupriavidus basilensis]